MGIKNRLSCILCRFGLVFTKAQLVFKCECVCECMLCMSLWCVFECMVCVWECMMCVCECMVSVC